MELRRRISFLGPRPFSTRAGPLKMGGQMIASALRVIAAVLLLAGLVSAGGRVEAQQTGPVIHYVPKNWALIPVKGDMEPFGPGESFRLLFASKGERFKEPSDSGNSDDIADHNAFVQNEAAENETLKPYKADFRALASTKDADARDNTYTTYTDSDKGVPIYYVKSNGKVADDYEDLYDGSWDVHDPKDQHGDKYPHTLIWTGTKSDGTKSHRPLGSTDFVTFGELTVLGKELSDATINNCVTSDIGCGIYGLSPIFTVVAQITPVWQDWAGIPAGLEGGDSFRLLFVSKDKISITSTEISTYNAFAVEQAKKDAVLDDYGTDGYRVLGSTGNVNARDNTGTPPGSTAYAADIPIYWVGGKKVADDYKDLYDGEWGSNEPRDQYGDEVDKTIDVATGTQSDGTSTAAEVLGSTGDAQFGKPGENGKEIEDSLRDLSSGAATYIYVLSPVFEVFQLAAPTGLEAEPGDGRVTLTWTAPAAVSGGPAVAGYEYRRSSDGGATWDRDWTAIPESAPDGANAASYTVTGLENGTEYTFEVRAVDDADGKGKASRQVTAAPAGSAGNDGTAGEGGSGCALASGGSDGGDLGMLLLPFAATALSVGLGRKGKEVLSLFK